MKPFTIKLPKFLNIFGLKVKLKVTSDLPENAAGLYIPIKSLIKISPEHPSKDEVMHTLLHESGHAMFYRISIHQSVSREMHEIIVDNFATMLIENFDITPKDR